MSTTDWSCNAGDSLCVPCVFASCAASLTAEFKFGDRSVLKGKISRQVPSSKMIKTAVIPCSLWIIESISNSDNDWIVKGEWNRAPAFIFSTKFTRGCEQNQWDAVGDWDVSKERDCVKKSTAVVA